MEMNGSLTGRLEDVEEFVAVRPGGVRNVVVDAGREEENEYKPDDEREADDGPAHGYAASRNAIGNCANTSAARIHFRPSCSLTAAHAPVKT